MYIYIYIKHVREKEKKGVEVPRFSPPSNERKEEEEGGGRKNREYRGIIIID